MRKVFFRTAAAGLAVALVCASSAWAESFYRATNMVADTESADVMVDPDLVNPWGVSQAPNGPLWVSDNVTHKTTIYDPSLLTKDSLVVDIAGSGSPTGTVFSPYASTGAFKSDIFLFVTLQGTIVGWRSSLSAASEILVDDSAAGSAYTGMAIARHKGAPRIYVANFARNSVDIYNADLEKIGGFTDPDLPDGFAPFNVQALNNKIYVAFAMRAKNGHEKRGAHLGYVDVFDTQGNLEKRLISGGALNAPWSMIIEPYGSPLAGDLLVGNFGDGRINHYDAHSGLFKGALPGAKKRPLMIDGLRDLWLRQSDQTLMFTSGPGQGTHGSIGIIEQVAVIYPSQPQGGRP